MSLAKKTNNWVKNNLISEQQAQAILTFEKSRHNNTFWRTAFIIAGLLIGLGIILIISANWEHIPEFVRLTGAFTLLGVFSYCTYWQLQEQHNGWKEFFAFLSFLVIGSTIGLISQTFNLDGSWRSFVLAWTMLGLPFVLVSRTLFFNIVWLLLFLSYFKIDAILGHCLDTVQLSILSTLILTVLSYAGSKLDEICHRYTLLAKALEKITIWSAYIVVFYIAGRWGLEGRWKGYGTEVWLANIFIFAFAAFRMFLAVRAQNVTSFKRNALLAEIYIFLLFLWGVKSLFTSGIVFILGGLLILLLIYVLRRTTQYIKRMEIFK